MNPKPQAPEKFKRDASGRPYKRIPHPAVPGQRIKVKARNSESLERKLAMYDELRLAFALGLKSRDEVDKAVAVATRLKMVTVGECFDKYERRLEHDVLDKVKSARKHQLSIFMPKSPEALTQEIMLEWEKAFAPLYARRTLTLAIEFLAAAVRASLPYYRRQPLPWHPFTVTKGRPERPREKFNSLHELGIFLRACARQDIKAVRFATQRGDMMTRAVVVALQAPRSGEAAAWHWDHCALDWSPASITIEVAAKRGWKKRTPGPRPTEPTKTRKVHTLLLHPAAIVALRHQRELLKARGEYDERGPIFPNAKGEARGKNEVFRGATFKKVVREAKLPYPDRWSPHSLRHSAAHLEARDGATALQIMARTGQDSLVTVERYVLSARARLGASMIGGPAAGEPEPVLDTQGLIALLVECYAAIDTAREEAAKARGDRPAQVALRVHKAPKDLTPKLTMRELAALWLDQGTPRAKPPQVRARATRAYQNTYKRTLDETGDVRTVAQERGQEAYRRVIEHFWTCVREEAKARGIEPPKKERRAPRRPLQDDESTPDLEEVANEGGTDGGEQREDGQGDGGGDGGDDAGDG